MIGYAVADRVATVTLDRPDKLNALTGAMLADLIAAFDRADADDAVRAVIVTGSGRAFCAGVDLSEGADSLGSAGVPRRADGGIDYAHQAARDGGGLLTLRLFRCLKPVIAAINGPAIGVGVTMTLAMDIRIASHGARFGLVFARRGIVPEAASSWFLPRIVGISRALEWCLSGRIFGAEEALSGGLVSSLHDDADLLPVAHAIAREVAQGTAPVSVALTRQMLWRGLGMDHPMAAHRIDSRGIASRAASADFAEGANAFLEKRQPSFPDRVSTDMPDYFPWWEELDFG